MGRFSEKSTLVGGGFASPEPSSSGAAGKSRSRGTRPCSPRWSRTAVARSLASRRTQTRSPAAGRSRIRQVASRDHEGRQVDRRAPQQWLPDLGYRPAGDAACRGTRFAPGSAR
jgi:hypothetical protein